MPSLRARSVAESKPHANSREPFLRRPIKVESRAPDEQACPFGAGDRVV